MSRVHDALRRSGAVQPDFQNQVRPQSPVPPIGGSRPGASTAPTSEFEGLLERIEEIPFNPSPDAHLIDASRPHEAPSEEFRTFRTRLNHLLAAHSHHRYDQPFTG
jgi:protein-tyrosine kinase